MRPLVRSSLLLAAMAGMLAAQDPYCPRCPSAVRTELEESLSLDREFQNYSGLAKARPAAAASRPRLADSSNFIDELISQKMDADGVQPAPRTTDAEFLRRSISI